MFLVFGIVLMCLANSNCLALLSFCICIVFFVFYFLLFCKL